MGWFSDLVGSVSSDIYENIPQEVLGAYTDALPQIQAPDVTFKPFSVTTGLGNVGTMADGSTQFNLSPEQQALQSQLFGGAGQFLQQAMGSPQGRAEDVYARIRALQTPEEERQRMALEERLFNQGRLGVATNQYGGTPEQLAMAKAQEEARNAAALSALQQGQAEQAQAAQLASQFMQQGYAPQANLLNALQGGLNVAGMADVARRQQGQYDLESGVANLQGLIGQKQGLSNLYGQLYGSALSGVGGLVQGAAAGAGGLLSDFIGKIL